MLRQQSNGFGSPGTSESPKFEQLNPRVVGQEELESWLVLESGMIEIDNADNAELHDVSSCNCESVDGGAGQVNIQLLDITSIPLQANV